MFNALNNPETKSEQWLSLLRSNLVHSLGNNTLGTAQGGQI